MSKVVVIETGTNIVQGIIMASISDTPYANTYFVEYDPDNPVDHGNIYDANTNTFMLSPQQQDELQTKYAIEYAILQNDAWGP